MSEQLPEAPIAVLDVQLAEMGAVELPERQDGPYAGAFVVVRDGVRPVGILTAAAENGALGRLDPADLELPKVAETVTPSSDHFISAVICVVDDGASAVRCARSILAGTHQNVEVVVVNNRPGSNSLEQTIAIEFADEPRVRYHEESKPGLSAARNSGARVARGDVIAFTDDDVVTDSNWLSAVDAVLADESVDCVTGMILPLALETDAQWLLERFAGFGKGFEVRRFTLAYSADDPLFPFAAGRFGSGANISMRREVFAEMEGFDEVLGTGTEARGGEDLDTFIRLMMEGGTLVYEPASIVWHEHRAELDDLRKEMFGYGAGLSAVITKHMLGRYRSRLLRRIPAGFKLMFDPGSPKNVRKGTDFPRSLTWRERFGAAYGPIGYLRSRSTDDRRPSAAPSPVDFDAVWVTEVRVGADSTGTANRALSDLQAPPTPDGGVYGSARVLVRDVAGDPLGFVNVELESGAADKTAIDSAIAAQTDGAGSSHAPAPTTGAPRPKMSVVICTFDRPDSLLRAISSVLASDHQDFELVVVDNAPHTDSTREALASVADARVRYVPESSAGLSRARNTGMAAATGEIIAFTDDDVEVDPGWLSALADAFAAGPKVGLVTGLVPAAELDNEFQQRFDAAVHWSTELTRRSYDLKEHRLAKPTFPFRTGRMGAGANFAVSRECADTVGGFDTALGAGAPCGGGDDLDYFLRAIKRGWTLSYEPRALVWHHHRADGESLLKQVAAYGSGATAYAFKHAFDPTNYATLLRSVIEWVRSGDADDADSGSGPWHTHGGPKLPTTPMDRKLKRVWRRGAWRGPYLYLKGRIG